jgi:hypothetical protein
VFKDEHTPSALRGEHCAKQSRGTAAEDNNIV